MPVRRPMFRPRGGVFVATQRIKMAEGLFIEPGEIIPATAKRASLHRWFRRRMIGPLDSEWTVALLKRRQRRLEQDHEAGRLYSGGREEHARIQDALAGEPAECKLQERAAALNAAREETNAARLAANHAVADAAASARAAAKGAPAGDGSGQCQEGAQGAMGAPTGAQDGQCVESPPDAPTAPQGAGDAAMVDAGLADPDDAHVESPAGAVEPESAEPPPASRPSFELSTEPPESKRSRRRPHHH